MLTMSFPNLDEISRALTELQKEVGDDGMERSIQRSLIKASAPIVEHAQRLAPRNEDNGGKPHMADKIKVSTTLSRRQRRGFRGRKKGEVYAYIGAGPRGPAVLAEFGTQMRRWRRGKSTGRMPATPFMRPAWEAGKEKLLDDFSAALWVDIEKAVRRARRRAQRGTTGRR
jgi:HK97 gp10 family phage protein